MSHITIKTIETFANLNINAMSEAERTAFMFDFATMHDTSAHDIFQFMKTERDMYEIMSKREQMTLQNAVYYITVKVALFNARQCYRTMLENVA